MCVKLNEIRLDWQDSLGSSGGPWPRSLDLTKCPLPLMKQRVQILFEKFEKFEKGRSQSNDEIRPSKGKRTRAEERVRKTLVDQVDAAQGYAKGASKGQKKTKFNSNFDCTSLGPAYPSVATIFGLYLLFLRHRHLSAEKKRRARKRCNSSSSLAIIEVPANEAASSNIVGQWTPMSKFKTVE